MDAAAEGPAASTAERRREQERATKFAFETHDTRQRGHGVGGDLLEASRRSAQGDARCEGEWRQRVRLMRTRPADVETAAARNGTDGGGRTKKRRRATTDVAEAEQGRQWRRPTRNGRGAIRAHARRYERAKGNTVREGKRFRAGLCREVRTCALWVRGSFARARTHVYAAIVASARHRSISSSWVTFPISTRCVSAVSSIATRSCRRVVALSRDRREEHMDRRGSIATSHRNLIHVRENTYWQNILLEISVEVGRP